MHTELFDTTSAPATTRSGTVPTWAKKKNGKLPNRGIEYSIHWRCSRTNMCPWRNQSFLLNFAPARTSMPALGLAMGEKNISLATPIIKLLTSRRRELLLRGTPRTHGRTQGVLKLCRPAPNDVYKLPPIQFIPYARSQLSRSPPSPKPVRNGTSMASLKLSSTDYDRIDLLASLCT